MGWLFREDITRKELIAERTESWERKSGETIVQSECLAHCFRGGGFSRRTLGRLGTSIRQGWRRHRTTTTLDHLRPDSVSP